jgi:hypothetical protein
MGFKWQPNNSFVQNPYRLNKQKGVDIPIRDKRHKDIHILCHITIEGRRPSQ